VLYLAVPATLVAFVIWGRLFKFYLAQVVAPFYLLVPLFGVGSASALFGESLGTMRLVSMGLVVMGLVVIIFPAAWGRARRGSAC